MPKKLTLLLIAVVVAFAGGVTVGSYIINRGAVDQLPKTAVASIILDYGDGNITTYDNLVVNANENLMQLMQKAAKDNHIALAYKDYGSLGMLITQIGEKVNGTSSRYWQYWVNNKISAVGASSYTVRPGDVIEWKFISSKQ